MVGESTAEAVLSSQVANWNGSRKARRPSASVITRAAPRTSENSASAASSACGETGERISAATRAPYPAAAHGENR